ncbi:helix-turn-helix domain-containing protein [Streptomyces johnsoniae]|uniref:Helix-turn-helix domain-containing protein n=1 Tax=Streptomyces johnsoniae TaxID=3075532 RepID=A0ABU2SD18_9ACTN|nr:helix-turn-helix domain-containing protein [Streptomyces sp. DSM 41886]MDT0445970.1 helix-turn-helix domain-containing protein [Streptomyces sp. DSM 41886]
MRATPPPLPETLTIPEVMTALRLSRSKVYDLLRSGQLRSFRAGRSRRVPTEALRQYIDTQMGEAA